MNLWPIMKASVAVVIRQFAPAQPSPARRVATVWSRLALAASFFLGLCGTAATGLAQEFRVYSRVIDESPVPATSSKGSKAGSRTIERSLSYFHAGKAYGSIESTGEVTVFEPSADRFTIINSSRMVAVTLTLAEIERQVNEARQEAERWLLDPRDPSATHSMAELGKTRALIEFQLRPVFAEHYDSEQQRLTLKSPQMTYDVRCATVESPGITAGYLRYTDWTAQLNYVVHPHALLPGPRLALNSMLRQRGLIPTEVSLRADVGRELRLRAEHQIQWQLNRQDRQMIHQWETLLNSPELRKVPLEDFQRELVAQRTRSRS